MRGFNRQFGTRLFIAFSFIAAAAGRSFAVDVADLSADQVFTVLSLREQLVELRQWQCTLFKEQIWNQLSDLIASDLQQATSESDFKKRLDRLRSASALDYFLGSLDDKSIPTTSPLASDAKLLAQLRAIDRGIRNLSTADQAGKDLDSLLKAKQSDKANADGNRSVEMHADLVELTQLYDCIEPYLSERVLRWRYSDFTTTKQNLSSRELVLQGILGAIHDFAEDRRQLAVADLLLAQGTPQNDWLFDLLHIDPQQLRDLSSKLSSSNLTDLQSQSVSATRKKLRGLCDGAQAVLQTSAVQDAVSFLQRIYSIKWIDLPSASPQFIRLRIQPTSVTQRHGTQVTVVARMSVCRPSAATVAATQPVANHPGAAALVDEIPLGIVVSDVLMDFSDPSQPPRLKLRDTGLKIQVSTDLPVLRDAIHSLGLPEFVDVVSASVVLRNIDDASVELQLRAPPFGGVFGSVTPSEISVPPLIINRQGISVDWSELFKKQIDELRRKSEDQLNREFRLAAGLVGSIAADPRNDWLAGQIRYTAKLRIESVGTEDLANRLLQNLTLKVPLQLMRGEDGKWTVRSRGIDLGDESIDQLRNALARYVVQELKGGMPATDVKAEVWTSMARYVRIENLRWDPESDGKESIRGKLRFTYPLPTKTPQSVSASLNFVLLVRDGRIQLRDKESNLKDFLGMIRADLMAVVQDIADRLNIQIAQSVEGAIDGKELDFAGIKVKLTALREGQKVKIKAATADGKLEIDKIYFVSKLKPSEITKPEDLHPVDFDFTDAVLVKPKAADLFEQFTSIGQPWLRVSQVVYCREGVRADVGLHIDALGTDLALGAFTLGIGTAKFDAQQLRPIIEKALRDKFGEHEWDLGDFGPVTNVTVTVDAQGDAKKLLGLQAILKGDLKLRFLGRDLNLPFTGHLLPSFDAKLDTNAVTQTLQTFCCGMFDVAPAGIKIDKLTALDHPHGIEFDITAKVLDTIEVSAKGIRITTAGITASPCFSGELPGAYPLGPTSLILVNPGFELRLRSSDGMPPSIYFTGDVTLLSEGVEKVVKMHGKVGAAMPPKVLTSEGTVVLAGILPIYREEGSFKPLKGEIQLESKMIGPLAKLIDVHGQSTVLAFEALMRQSSSIRLLSLHLADTQMSILGKEKRVTASGKAKIPLTEADFNLEANPTFSHLCAEAGFGFGVGGFDGLAGRLKVVPSRAKLTFGVLGIDIVLYTPGVTSMTPSNVLRAIESAFDFDVSALWNALKHRKIVISLIPSKKGGTGEPDDRPVGEGDTPPTESDESSAPTAQPQQTTSAGHQQKEAGPQAGSSSPPVSTTQTDDKKTDDSRAKAMSQATTYRPGNATIAFIPEGVQNANHYIMRTTFPSSRAIAKC